MRAMPCETGIVTYWVFPFPLSSDFPVPFFPED